MLRAARPGDEAALAAFLAGHAETSMFLRASLAAHGLSDHTSAHGTAFWLSDGDEITAVFGISNAGYVQMQAPGAGPALYRAFAARIAGRAVKGVTGIPEQVAVTKDALGIAAAGFALDATEPLYRLALDELALPPGPGAIRVPSENRDRRNRVRSCPGARPSTRSATTRPMPGPIPNPCPAIPVAIVSPGSAAT